MTSPPEDGSGAALAMDNAIKDAKLAPDQIQHVNAHATSTNLGDVAEAAGDEENLWEPTLPNWQSAAPSP